MKQIVSLSGGKDSTAMLLMMLDRGERVDEAIMFDGGWEYPEMYEHIEQLRKAVDVPITILRPEQPFEYYMFDYKLKKGNHKGQAGYGFPRPFARWCTRIKNTVLDKYVETLGDAVQCIGIAADENRPLQDCFRYPLVEWGVNERDALVYCYERGFTWGGLYQQTNRLSCWCCPLQSMNSARVLRRTHPELWEKLIEMEHRLNNKQHGMNNITFRIDHSAEELERIFAAEDMQMKLEI